MATDRAARSQPGQGGVEDAEAAAADEDPVRVGKAGQGGRGLALDDRDARPGQVGPQPGDVVGPALDGEHPQAGGEPGALDGHRPDPAPTSHSTPAAAGQLAEGDGADLGLGDHPVAVGVRARRAGPRPSPIPSAESPAVGRHDEDDRQAGRTAPAASPARSPVHTASSGSPSRLPPRR